MNTFWKAICRGFGQGISQVMRNSGKPRKKNHLASPTRHRHIGKTSSKYKKHSASYHKPIRFKNTTWKRKRGRRR